jgi:HD-GYP domain-containing protein (c-di-GMP phosphodiesterase class II)
MTNIVNGTTSIATRSFAWGLRKGFAVSTGHKPVQNFLGTRQALIIGREDRWWNRSVTGHYLTKTVDLAGQAAAFSPKTTREVLLETATYLRLWGHKPIGEYFYPYESGRYGAVVNTSLARSAFLGAAFEGEPLLPIDKKIAGGQISEPINDIFHLYKYRKYSITDILKKFGLFFGAPRSFIIIPVYGNDGQVIGKVNIGLADTTTLSPGKIEVLRSLAGKIKDTDHNHNGSENIDMGMVKGFVRFIDKIPLRYFAPLAMVPKLSESMGLLVALLSDMIERAISYGQNRDRWYGQVLEMLAGAIDAKEAYTGNHCVRVEKFATAIARRLPQEVWVAEMRRKKVPEADWPKTIEREKELIGLHALIHDVGKIAVPDLILNKETRLTRREWAIMSSHPELGGRILKRGGDRYPDNPLLGQAALDTVLLHHRHWAGGGYPPSSLKGNDLPLGPRVTSVSDVYQAMSSRRCYQVARTPETVVRELIVGAGTVFDPAVVRTGLEVLIHDNEAEIEFMMEELISALKTLPRTDRAQKFLLEELMIKLRGGGSVAELDAVVDGLHAKGLLFEGSATQASGRTIYQAMIGKVQEKKADLIARATAGREFFDSVLAPLTNLFFEYSNHDHYAAEAVRLIIGELFAAWSRGQQQPLIELFAEAFKQAHDKLALPAGSKPRSKKEKVKQQMVEDMNGFSKFFFRNLSRELTKPATE